MAMLLLLILGATYLIKDGSRAPSELTSIRPAERVLFSDVYDLSNPTTDDVLQTLVAVEEDENGR
jgi:hypothetical protein